jgi:hypothetical protein
MYAASGLARKATRAALDLGQISAAAAYLSEDVVVRLGNREPVPGMGAVVGSMIGRLAEPS